MKNLISDIFKNLFKEFDGLIITNSIIIVIILYVCNSYNLISGEVVLLLKKISAGLFLLGIICMPIRIINPLFIEVKNYNEGLIKSIFVIIYSGILFLFL